MADGVVDEADTAGSPKDKLLTLARKRFTRAMESEEDNRDHALACIKFRNLEQWNPEVKNAREKDPEGARPCLVVDKTNQYINQVINDYRQNRPAIKVRPVDDKGDPEVADIFNGIIRHIEDRSGADLAYDTAYESSVDGGFGYFRILTEYCDEMSFEQDIRIQRIRNRFTVLLDPDRQEPDGSDAKWGFILDKVQRDDFKREYPKADPCDYATDGKIFNDWVFKDYVIVAEYFYIEPKKTKICMYSDGEVYEDGKAPLGLTKMVGQDGKLIERETTINTVKWKKISAKDVLDERDWPGKFIPIVEEIGNELDIEGRSVKYGLLRGAMEPQKMHNVAASSFMESVGMAPRATWVAAEAQIEGHEELYRTANRRAITVLPYKPVVMEGGVPVPPPQRVAPPGVPVGWLQTMQNTEHDIQASMGMYASTTLGQGDAQSGKQEMLQQRRGDTATFHYSDNSRRSIAFAGRILIDLIPKIYDTERVVRIMGEDGEPGHAALNPNQDQAVVEQPKQGGGIQKIYNLGVGKYDVVATAGPGFLTKRLEATEFLSNAAQAAKDPVTAQVLTYLAIKNNDWAGADEATKMLKALLPPQVAEIGSMEGEEQGEMVQTPKGPIPAAQAGQVIAGLMQNVDQLGQAIEQADILGKENAAKELEIKSFEAESDRIRAESEKLKATSEVANTNANLSALANAAAAQAVQELLNTNVIVRQ